LFQVSVHGGEPVPMPGSMAGMMPLDISPDGSELLAAQLTGVPYMDHPFPIWVVPVLGNGSRRLGDLRAQSARWSPDGGQIAYAAGREIRIARRDGTDLRKLVSVDGEAQQLVWSRDGKRIRFAVTLANSSSLWEVAADGTGLHALFPQWRDVQQTGGNWTADGEYFLFAAGRDRQDIWVQREKTGLFDRSGPRLVQLTTGPMQTYSPAPSSDGRRIFFLGGLLRGELVRYDSKAREWRPYMAGLSAVNLSFSPDGKWVTYTSYPEGALWRSAIDGTQRLQLAPGPVLAGLVSWSPDSTRITFSAGATGTPARIWVVPSEGGAPQQVTHGESGPRGDIDPNFSSDGQSLIFSSLPPEDILPPDKVVLRNVDLKTGKVSVLPGTETLWSPRLSPDGRYIAALSVPKWKLMLYDRETHQQVVLADMNAGWPSWSRDGQFLYFITAENDLNWYRVRLATRKTERLAGQPGIMRQPLAVAAWSGLAPDSSLLSIRDTGATEIYALDWERP